MYRDYRNEFIAWAARKFRVGDEKSKDIFQEVIIDFHQNIVSGRLTDLTCTTKTYLFQLGKNKVINLINRESRLTYNIDPELIKGKEHEDYVNEEHKAELQDKISRAIDRLPEDCQKLLELFYSKGYDMDSIAREMGYKNADTAKSKKSLCMKKLFDELNKLTMFLML